MAKEFSRNIRLGIFVLAGTVFLIAMLYLIGSKQNLFGSTFRISARFYTVNGLMPGNNVRFAGIDVGTVEKVEIISDSTVNVIMLIEEKVRPYIKRNAVASVGTDGLMGNKLININSSANAGESVQEGDVIQTIRPIEMDDMARTLSVTNENMKAITNNLRSITEKINKKNTLWSLLEDTIMAENVKSTIVNIKRVSNETAVITGNLREVSENIRNGKGTLGALITDTSLASHINQVIVRLDNFSDTAAIITGDISRIIGRVEKGQGSVGVLLTDTTFVHLLNQSMENIRLSSENFNQNMEALKHSFLLRGYFRRQEKIKAEEKK
jgi:phospholipid/cholesterol/gamma-HCH transport system substrate-binding protein